MHLRSGNFIPDSWPTKYEFNEEFKNDERDLCREAARRGNLDQLMCLRDMGYHWNHWTTSEAAERGNLSCLQYAICNGCPFDRFLFTYLEFGQDDECIKYCQKFDNMERMAKPTVTWKTYSAKIKEDSLDLYLDVHSLKKEQLKIITQQLIQFINCTPSFNNPQYLKYLKTAVDSFGSHIYDIYEFDRSLFNSLKKKLSYGICSLCRRLSKLDRDMFQFQRTQMIYIDCIEALAEMNSRMTRL